MNAARVTRRELAQRLDVVMGTVTKWEQAGCPVLEPGRKGKPSYYSEAAVRKWRADREDLARVNGTVDVARERARKEKAQAILAEQTVAMRAEGLVPAEQIEKAWAAEVSAVRAKVLSWPATIADRLVREAIKAGLSRVETFRSGAEKVLDEAVAEGLLELSVPKVLEDAVAPPAPKRTARKK